MRRLIPSVAFLLAFLLMTASAFAGPKILKVGYFRLEPHMIPKEGGTPTGAAIDYFKKFVAPEMGVEVEYVGPMTLPRLESGLEDGSLDAAVLLAKNPERMAKFVFPVQPFNEMVSSVAVLNENKLRSVADVKDLNGVAMATGDGVFIHPVLRDANLKFDRQPGVEWLPTCLKKLDAKRIEALYNPDRTSTVYADKLLALSEKIRVVEIPNTTVGQYTVFSKKSGELAASYDAALRKVRGKTTYAAILAPYLK